MVFYSVKQLLQVAEQRALPLWKLILDASAEESGISPEQSWGMMSQRLQAMHQADSSYDPAQRSKSGLSGGDGEKMRLQVESGRSICGDFIGAVLSAALRMGECNACMHCIVAAPTAGACGVLPAVLLPYGEKYGLKDDALIRALYISAGFGAVIAQRASISGAEAGCQAEIGSASAMAAAALVYLHGGDNEQMAAAVAIALKNMMGLVCDPVAGLVEVPCIKRNGACALQALLAAQLALSGITSFINADEAIDAMKSVGDSLPCALKETAGGGMATTPSALAWAKEYFARAHK